MNEQYQKWLNAIRDSDLSDPFRRSSLATIEALSMSGAPVVLNLKHLALLVGVDYGVLHRMIHSIDKFYRSYTIKKRNGGERKIDAPYPSLKAVQSWIADSILAKTADPHPFSVGFVKGKRITDNASPHLGNQVLLKMDIKDFFPSIKEKSVRRHFRELGYDVKMSCLLASLCCKDSCLPQGAPTSPLLSNILYRPMDDELFCLAQSKGLSYTRYADDMTFSGNRISVSTINEVASIVRKYGLKINREKTRRSGKTSRKIITGVSISSGKMTIPRVVKREIRQKAHYMIQFGVGNYLNHIESRDLLVGYRLLGQLAYWHSVEPDNEYVLKTSDALIKVLKKRELKNTEDS